MHQTCPTCGGEIPARKGALEVRNNPPAVYWRGVKQPRLTGQKHAFLFELTARQFVTHLALELMTGEEATSRIVPVVICQLRKWLRDRGIPARIVNINRQGYLLELA